MDELQAGYRTSPTLKTARTLALCLAFAAFVHRLTLASNQFILATDSGTLGLMALNIIDGERPLFLYDFSYSGAPLAYLCALSVRLFGANLTALALPVTLLTGLWVWLMFLLFRRIAGTAAGLAAALAAAFPDRMTAWYSHTPDTSYGAFLPLTTALLWLAVEIEARDLRGGRLAAWMAVLGAVGGLAIWTNLMVIPYLLVAAIPIVILLRRRLVGDSAAGETAVIPEDNSGDSEHSSRTVLASGRWGQALASLGACLVGVLCFLAASCPLWRVVGGMARGSTVSWKPEAVWILENFRTMATGTIPAFFQWSINNQGLEYLAGWFYIYAGVVVGVGCWARPWRVGHRWRAALPPLLIVLYLFFYLPHAMAHTVVPRYLLPLSTMFAACAMAVPMGSASRGFRVAAGVLLAAWVAVNLHGTLGIARLGQIDKATRLERRARITTVIEDLGARSAIVLGDYYFQSEANGMTFLTRRRVEFAGAGRERYRPIARAAEREERRVIVCQRSLVPAARASLAALEAAWEETPIDDTVTLLHDMRSNPRPRRAIPARDIRVAGVEALRGSVVALTDANHRTILAGESAGRGGFTLDLGRERLVCGLDLLPPTSEGLKLPTHGQVELSLDAHAFTNVVPWAGRIPIAYAAGDTVFLAGGQGRAAFAFPPVRARYLRFTGALPHGSPLDIPSSDDTGGGRGRRLGAWHIAEARVFEALDDRAAAVSGAEDKLSEMVDYLAEMGVAFVACDRWLIPRLPLGRSGARPPATYPLYENPRHLQGDGLVQELWTFKPSPESAVIIARELAGAQVEVLRQALGRAEPWLLSEHGDHVSFVFLPTMPPDPPTLTWDGAMLVW